MAQGLAQKLGDVAGVEPPHQIEAVHFDRTDADLQRNGDLAVSVPHRYHLEDLRLTGSNLGSLFLSAFCRFEGESGIASTVCHRRCLLKS